MPPPTSISSNAAPAPRRTPAPNRRRTVDTASQKPTEFKVIVLGDSGAGKSSLIRQFVQRVFDERLMATVGCDFYNKVFTIDVPTVSLHDPVIFGRTADSPTSSAKVIPAPMFEDGILNAVGTSPPLMLQSVALQIWDTAGAERYNTLGSLFFRGCDGCLLVYDITSQRSFKNLQAWADEFFRHVPKRVPVVVAGNKSDRPTEEHAVPLADVVTFCRARGFLLINSSGALDAGSSSAPATAELTIPSIDAATPTMPQRPADDVETSSRSDDSGGHSPSRTSTPRPSRKKAVRPLELPLQPASVTSSAVDFEMAEDVFVSLAREMVLQRMVDKLRATDGVRLGLITAEELAAHGGLLGDGPDAVKAPTAKIQLSRAPSGRLDGNGQAGAAPRQKKKCGC